MPGPHQPARGDPRMAANHITSPRRCTHLPAPQRRTGWEWRFWGAAAGPGARRAALGGRSEERVRFADTKDRVAVGSSQGGTSESEQGFASLGAPEPTGQSGPGLPLALPWAPRPRNRARAPASLAERGDTLAVEIAPAS